MQNDDFSTNDELIQEIEFLEGLQLEGELSEWEDSFVTDMSKKLEKGHSLSAKQVEKIEELYDRYS